jgi:ubiquinone/menaquinone biosynthesis C-methylase UbiE
MNATKADPYEAFVGFYDEWTAGLTEDITFYVRRAIEAPGPVVELGVGTGRIAIPTAQAGRRVIGVDVSLAMLEETRRRAGMAGVADRIALAHADMRGFVAEAPVHLVTIPFRSFLHLQTVEDQLRCLSSVRRSLVDGGRLILNVFVPIPAYIVSQDRRRNLHREYTDALGRRCEIWVTPVYEMTSQRLDVDVTVERYDGRRLAETTETSLHLRMVYPREMEHLLARAGFEVDAVYGDFDERPLEEGSTEMIWVARKL